MSNQFKLSALNENADVEVGKTYGTPLRVNYTNRFYGSCVVTARLRKAPTGLPELDRASLTFTEVQVRRGTPQALTAAAESFVIGQVQRAPEAFRPRSAKPAAASESVLEPALRQLRRLTP